MNINSIVWFRQDLRINDNPAIYNAAINSNVFPIYIYESDIQNLKLVRLNNGGFIMR